MLQALNRKKFHASKTRAQTFETKIQMCIHSWSIQLEKVPGTEKMMNVDQTTHFEQRGREREGETKLELAAGR